MIRIGVLSLCRLIECCEEWVRMTLSNEIKQLAARAAGSERPVRIIDADVVSTSPLRIRLSNNEKLVLSSERFIIPEKLTDYELSVRTPRGTETHTFFNALKTGDQIVVVSLQGGGMYYVLDRKG